MHMQCSSAGLWLMGLHGLSPSISPLSLNIFLSPSFNLTELGLEAELCGALGCPLKGVITPYCQAIISAERNLCRHIPHMGNLCVPHAAQTDCFDKEVDNVTNIHSQPPNYFLLSFSYAV
jgi:hypothetical protein